jgi:hypothetical protein
MPMWSNKAHARHCKSRKNISKGKTITTRINYV